MDILSKNKIKSAIDNAYNAQPNKNPRKLKHAIAEICCVAH